MTGNEDSGFRSPNLNHDVFTIPASTSVTFNFGSGTDTATNRYVDVGGMAFGLQIITIATAVSISHFSGRPLKSPMSLGTTAGFNSQNIKVSSVTIVTGSTATVVEVHAKGGY